MTAQILAIATAHPTHQADLAFSTHCAQSMSCEDETQANKLAKLYRRTGVDTRGSVLVEKGDAGELTQSFYPPLVDGDDRGPTMETRNDRFAAEAPALATQAGQRAIDASGVKPSEITHVVTVTCTGFNAPGIDVQLIERLNLPVTTQRVQVGFMGCHGLINAMRTARGLVAVEPEAVVLIVCIELCSLHYQYGYDAQRIVSGSLFADGSAGLIVAGAESSNRDGHSDPIGEILTVGSCLIPDSQDAMTWRIGDNGFIMTLEASVPGFIEANLRGFMEPWLAKAGLTLDQIGGWAVHPGGVRILQSVEVALGLEPDALDISREVLREHGNMSSATLGFVLQKFTQRRVPGPWLMLGFGPGLEIEVAVVR
ncbi:type III polyketide synthase [Rhodopirellula halodulae]|uniref:type III polyketide synthase n=1 Tax=Rhodopirellula halodulae TaxID=2894198 RepID=UPI001E4C48F5|nr:type III polyketide synthase [Rhodopirellula sp. JC737]MCC9657031.1 type III polyketide synthase [Rhodopirellula sp. JC737]